MALKIVGPDFFDLSALLSEEEIAVQNMTNEWVRDRFYPLISKHYRDGTFPFELQAEMGEMGFFGSTLPEKYGTAGINGVAYGLMMQELERGDSGLRSFASVQGSLVMWPIWKYGSEEQKEKWLPLLASGEKIGCFGLTEPDYGSNPGGMITRVKQEGDKFILNGTKMWITNSPVADVALIWAKDEGGEVRGFLVERGTGGFETPEIKGKLSLRASMTGEIVLNNCAIPLENQLPEANGLKAPLSCLTQARYGINWGVMGAAIACYEEAVDYAKTRIQFDKPIAAFQLTQQKLAEMLNEITKAQFLTLQLGRLKDRATLNHKQVSLAKMNNVRMAIEIARSARTILGASGITDEYVSMRHAANLESVLTYEGTHEMHTLVVGESITGIPAYR
ncbi:MAG: acyl-CoA dehydrogenase [Candidatus Marinimicrobia bacterium]|jgi:glutaryl-CoA dehydrogenase|nr:acyl-CoA dehydrogenase [Candidatus Neomarinimicrobiota bacterium]MBT4362286.1 acyl-CoA dehydrogenase [Candidatus Neomarinimicrobiota bacterium]MBT4713799.1 acyl-CoA dehydrogenase [Candidatus Neomarinimicrobiota bacterium]MBT4944926.1 acyl-CoA dehydrogenase [Candidatus Neomarinimicrobiota bacterium]MBT5270203.1 acyl-CoA dehydrogenase [Candidatus Neomarinimicrobiota bacterium]